MRRQRTIRLQLLLAVNVTLGEYCWSFYLHLTTDERWPTRWPISTEEVEV